MAPSVDLQRELREHRRAALERHLQKHLRGEIRFDAPTRALYSTDASIYQIEPLGVVLPCDAEDWHTAIQIALEHEVPLVPRGGGTSLSGQTVGPGLVLDGSKYLNQILEIDPEGRRVRVQPGVVLDHLNQAVEPYGLQFGPEVSTANRATLGGMIANNSAGARSVVYGKTLDHVRELSVILADGARVTLGPTPLDLLNPRSVGDSRWADVHRVVGEIVRQHRAEIETRFPRILRRVSGYNLDSLVKGWDAGVVNLADLVVGSEGTLAVITEAELHLVRRPRFRGLLVPHFTSLTAALDTLDLCLSFSPSAVELMDQMILDLARENLALRRRMAAITGRPAAVFMVEFSGDQPADVAGPMEKLTRKLRAAPGVTEVFQTVDDAQREPVWRLREAGLPLLMGLPGDRKPVTFVEDTAVAPERLPEFVRAFQDLIAEHGTHGAFYGHASVGCLHIRPVLNLKDAGDVARMRQISAAVTDLVRRFEGSLSGEHGDGLVRSEWNRKMFGSVVYEAFRRLKRAFDPKGLMNPGKIVDAPPMTDNLRLGPDYHPVEPETVFDFSAHGGFARHVELCSGTGVCRKEQGGVMCPSFRATRDEADSTRGRANALRLAMTGEAPLKALAAPWVHEILDLCLSCKACKSECPSNVDMAKLKAEVDHLYYQRRGRPVLHHGLAWLPWFYRYGAWAGPVVNAMGRWKPLRWFLERAIGLDRRRSLPPLHARNFRWWLDWRRPNPRAGRRGRVLLLDDCFTTYNEPRIGKAAVTLLETLGYRVERTGLDCCGRILISKGFLTEARNLIQRQASWLASRLTDDAPILGLEPSCLLTLVDEWPSLAPSSATERVARAARLADEWLAEQARHDPEWPSLQPLDAECLVHGHCHQKSLVGMEGTAAALKLVPKLQVRVLDTGCCGMAGAFGFEADHFDLSVRVAELSVLPDLAKAATAMVVATGTSCRHQIKDLTGRTALHPVEVLAQQVAAAPDPAADRPTR